MASGISKSDPELLTPIQLLALLKMAHHSTVNGESQIPQVNALRLSLVTWVPRDTRSYWDSSVIVKRVKASLIDGQRPKVKPRVQSRNPNQSSLFNPFQRSGPGTVVWRYNSGIRVLMRFVHMKVDCKILSPVPGQITIRQIHQLQG